MELIKANNLHGDDGDTISGDSVTAMTRRSYTILNEADIRQRQEDDIAKVSTTLFESRSSAIILLHYFNWNLCKLFDEWFDNEEEVRKIVGLFGKPIVDQSISSDRPITCGICFESYNGGYSNSYISYASCGHPYCRACWGKYISKSINNDGPGCLVLKCPAPSCGASVGQDMVTNLALDFGDKFKFSRYLLRSYVEDNYRRKKIKWCPAPDCDYVVEFVDFISDSKGFDISCLCSHNFCWNCNEEAHRPVDCDTVEKWISKNRDESESTNWILVNTKPCPKCKRSIEKNHGCNHMTCTPPCKFEFCWICLGAWSNKRGHSCNSFSEEGNDEEKRKEMAKASLFKYTHYYERWAANLRSKQKAMEDLRLLQSENLDRLSVVYGQQKPLFRFITEAWQQIIQSRRVLQWTYAYGYYLPEHEWAKKQFFECLQREAEFFLEKLHHCAEKQVEMYINGEGSIGEFIEYCSKLAELTCVIRNYFKNLVRALEDGLSEVDSKTVHWSCQLCGFANPWQMTACQLCSQSPMAVEL
ncbi:hypothetical protein UlMin_034327 [Ulmus minor]